MLFLLLACKNEASDLEDPGCGDPTATDVVILKTITFGRRDAENHTWGFNLDGLVSDASDAKGCYKPDLETPDGQVGIDSSFSGLVPVLEQTEARAVEGIIQEGINTGEILIGVELSKVDDRQNDSCVGMRVVRAKGPPMMGTDGYIEAGQTYDIDPDALVSTVEKATIVDGSLTAGPFDWGMTIDVLAAHLDFTLHDAYVHYELAEDGGGQGYMGGGLNLQYLIDFLATASPASYDIAKAFLPTAADLKPDSTGACTEISAVIEFSTTPGFFYEDPPVDSGL